LALQEYETVEEQRSRWRQELRVAGFFSVLGWLVIGGIAGLWWLPAGLGATSPIPWELGALCLLAQWFMVFNHWPRVGTRQFFSNSSILKRDLPLLLLITAFFAAGFAIAA
jgi:hypothetical protein